jgi:hypothetical protein
MLGLLKRPKIFAITKKTPNYGPEIGFFLMFTRLFIFNIYMSNSKNTI